MVRRLLLGEQRAGFANGQNREKNERTLTKLLNNPGVFIMHTDEQTTYFYADLFAYLRKKGKPIPDQRPLDCGTCRSAPAHFI
ncbi:MAG: hypothetical protein ABL927_08400 [Bdellovibrionales bacterium]